MEDSFIKTIDLCRYYRRSSHEIRAVDHVGFGIHRGESVAVVGASGSGKSTLLNLIAGLDTPTSGRVEISGISLGSLSEREIARYRSEKTGMIFQSFNLLTHLSALKNVEMALYFSGISRKERRKKALAVLEKLGLGRRVDHRPADLSGGEQQRVAIARALVKEPEILFADEPTGNLDRENSYAIADILKELNSRGFTIILVTHDTGLAGKINSRIIKMDYGRIDSPASAGAENGI